MLSRTIFRANRRPLKKILLQRISSDKLISLERNLSAEERGFATKRANSEVQEFFENECKPDLHWTDPLAPAPHCKNKLTSGNLSCIARCVSGQGAGTPHTGLRIGLRLRNCELFSGIKQGRAAGGIISAAEYPVTTAEK